MKHGHARECLAAILMGTGFDERAQALVHAALMRSDPVFAEDLGALIHHAARELPLDHGDLSSSPKLTSALPDGVEELCAQLAPLIIDHPQDIAAQVASLQQLCGLWPHASREERAHLRLNWLGSLSQRQSPPGSYVLRATLREWQRDLPTVGGDGNTCAAVLCDMLQSSSAKEAYGCLSMYLGAHADLPTLAWTLGVLSEQILLHHFDPHSHSIRALIGTIACEQLVAHTRPEVLVTIVSQLAHYIWWSSHHNKRRELRPSNHPHDMSLFDAVSSGDIYAAQRAARVALADRNLFWHEVAKSLALVVELGHRSWTSAVDAVIAVRYRGGDRAVLSPDDAATVGAALASAKYRADHHSQRLVAVQ